MNEEKTKQENEVAVTRLSPTTTPLVRQILSKGHVPDILTCIANLSSDEVFTPPELVDKMLDIFPEEVWHDSSLKWLDPACKTGIFLRQIAKRLMEGLRDEFSDEEARRQHIFKNMLYGIAVTDLTALMSRRSLYTSKNASGDKSIAKFDDENGNISYDNRPHTYKNGACIYCGNKEGGELDRDGNQERHAYNFIHLTEEEIKNMKFDAIVGNPPYQLNSGGHGAQATPIYHYFVQQAIKLNPRYVSFITPSRWFAGGMGLSKFRKDMLSDRRIKILVDYPNASDCFPGVEIKGGVSYFIWEKNYSGDCEIHTIVGGEELLSSKRKLDEWDVFIRWNQAVSILKKIQNRKETTVDNKVSGLNPFNLPTNFSNTEKEQKSDSIRVYTKDKDVKFVKKNAVSDANGFIPKYKVLLSKAAEGGGSLPNNVLGRPFIAEPSSCCTMTYFVASAFNDLEKAKNFEKYIKTRFFRFLVFLRKNTQDLNKEKFSFVPDLPMDREWTDEKLYERYGITPEEQKFIESLVKEMA